MVSSGVSTLTWIVFLPLALGFGFVAQHHGIHAAGGMLTLLTAAAGSLLVCTARAHRTPAGTTSSLAGLAGCA